MVRDACEYGVAHRETIGSDLPSSNLDALHQNRGIADGDERKSRKHRPHWASRRISVELSVSDLFTPQKASGGSGGC